MVETITPVVHGGSRTRWGIAVGVHTAAATAVAGAFGAVLGAAGEWLGAPWGSGGALVVAAVATWALGHEAFGAPFPVPQLRRQVPDWWRTFFSPLSAAALYGAGLGVGFLTYLQHATLVVVSVAATATGSPLVGATMLAPFGLARGLSAIAAAAGRDVVPALASFARPRGRLAAVNAAAVGVVVVAATSSVRANVEWAPLGTAVLVVAFGWSAAWKAARPGAWRAAVGAYGLGGLTIVAAVAVPSAEAMVVVLALFGATNAAAMLALVLLAAFTVGAVRHGLQQPGRLPCGCFGSAEVSMPALLVRNAGLALVAGALLGAARPDAPSMPAVEPLPAALSLVGVAGAVVAAASVHRALVRGRG